MHKFTILLSRTDSIGDVVLTLPMAGFIKKHFPGAKVLFLGRDYTRAVIGLSAHVDEFISYDELLELAPTERLQALKQRSIDHFVHVFPVREIASLAKKAGVKNRVGTTNRLYHWFTCNRLVPLSRKRSNLHESQLNIKLLSFLGVDTEVEAGGIKELYGFRHPSASDTKLTSLLDPQKFNLVIHPTSKGSAKEWGLKNYAELASRLPREKFTVFVTGTTDDARKLQQWLGENPALNDMTGKFSLPELITFINACDGLVAASTGPLHIAAALGKRAIGLFSPRRPIHPGRWKPMGEKASALVFDENCENCSAGRDCDCIAQINPKQVIDLLVK